MQERENKIKEISELFKSISFMTFKKSFAEFKIFGIHPGQIMLIDIIYNNPGIKQKDLVEMTKREKATIAIALKRLEKSGFVEKKDDPNDKRSSLYHLTKKGQEIRNEFKDNKKEDMNKLLDVLNEEEIDNIINILHKIKENLEKEIIT